MPFRASPPTTCAACGSALGGKPSCPVCGLAVRPSVRAPRWLSSILTKHHWRRWIFIGGIAGFLLPLFLRYDNGGNLSASGESRFSRIAGRAALPLSPNATRLRCSEPLCEVAVLATSAGVQSCPDCGTHSLLILPTETGWLEPAPDLLRGFLPSGAAALARDRSPDNAIVALWFQTFRRLRVTPPQPYVQSPESTWRTKTGDASDHAIFLADILLSQGYRVRAVTGHFRGRSHSWVVLDYEGKEYLLDLLANRPALFPPRVSAIGADYRAELAFDREACYFPRFAGASTSRYFDPGLWHRVTSPSSL